MLINKTDAGTLLVQSGDDSIELTTDEALDLFGRLSGLLPVMTTEELVRVDDVWTCPHCRQGTELIEYDSHQGESDADFNDDGDVLYVSQVDTERATMAFLCATCRRAVELPDGVEVVWS